VRFAAAPTRCASVGASGALEEYHAVVDNANAVARAEPCRVKGNLPASNSVQWSTGSLANLATMAMSNLQLAGISPARRFESNPRFQPELLRENRKECYRRSMSAKYPANRSGSIPLPRSNGLRMAHWFDLVDRLFAEQGKGDGFMVALTERAVSKVKEIIEAQAPRPAGPRIAVVGGGCSGFSYSMSFENNPGMLDKGYNSDGFKVFVDQASLLYLDGVEVDFVDTLEGSGFKFNNPHVKST